jgi:hypothetical protein
MSLLKKPAVKGKPARLSTHEHADPTMPASPSSSDARELAEIELAAEAVHDGAAAEEERGLEERVRDDVERRAVLRARQGPRTCSPSCDTVE